MNGLFRNAALESVNTLCKARGVMFMNSRSRTAVRELTETQDFAHRRNLVSLRLTRRFPSRQNAELKGGGSQLANRFLENRHCNSEEFGG